MLNFYDCDKNLSENDFNEVEKKLEVSFPASFKSHYFIIITIFLKFN